MTKQLVGFDVSLSDALQQQIMGSWDAEAELIIRRCGSSVSQVER